MNPISALAGLGEQVFKFLAVKGEKSLSQERTKYADEIAETREKIRVEKARGFEASQARIEGWEERLMILAEAAQNALIAHLAAGG